MKSRMFFAGAAVAGLLITASHPNAQTVFDDFSDLNDTVNPTWTHDSGLSGSTGQTWDASTGVYRLQAPNNGLYQSIGYIGSLVGPVSTDVHVSADFVSFINNNGYGGVFGLMARVTGPSSFNSLTGYAYAYEPFADQLKGEMVLYKINGLNVSDRGSFKVTLDPNKDYRFVLDITGATLHGQVFEIGGELVAERYYTDPSPYLSGRSGVWGYSAPAYQAATDFSVDNFSTTVPEPSAALLIGLGLLGVLGRGRFCNRV